MSVPNVGPRHVGLSHGREHVEGCKRRAVRPLTGLARELRLEVSTSSLGDWEEAGAQMSLRHGLLLVLVPATVVSCKANDGPIGSKAESTPDALVRELVEAARSGDLERYRDCFAEGPRKAMKEIDTLVATRLKASSILDEAVDQKFGKSLVPRVKRDPGKDLANSIVSMEILTRKAKGSDTVELEIKRTGRPADGGDDLISGVEVYTAVREAGKWKLVPPKPVTHEQLEEIRADVKNWEFVCERIAKEVAEDKYQSRREAYAAALEALKERRQDPH